MADMATKSERVVVVKTTKTEDHPELAEDPVDKGRVNDFKKTKTKTKEDQRPDQSSTSKDEDARMVAKIGSRKWGDIEWEWCAVRSKDFEKAQCTEVGIEGADEDSGVDEDEEHDRVGVVMVKDRGKSKIERDERRELHGRVTRAEKRVKELEQERDAWKEMHEAKRELKALEARRDSDLEVKVMQLDLALEHAEIKNRGWILRMKEKEVEMERMRVSLDNMSRELEQKKQQINTRVETEEQLRIQLEIDKQNRAQLEKQVKEMAWLVDSGVIERRKEGEVGTIEGALVGMVTEALDTVRTMPPKKTPARKAMPKMPLPVKKTPALKTPQKKTPACMTTCI